MTLDASADLDGAQPFQLLLDDSLFVNTINATGPTGTVIVNDAAGADTCAPGNLGPIVENWSCLGYDVTTVTSMATARLAARTTNTPRLGKVIIDVMTGTYGVAYNAVSLEPLDRVSLSIPDTATQAALGASTIDGIVEGWTWTAGLNDHTVALDLAPLG